MIIMATTRIRVSYGCHKNYYNCHNNYYSARLKDDECMYNREPSPLDSDAVRPFWKRGEGVNQHCDLRHTALQTHNNKFACYSENQSGGSQKPQPTEADMEQAEQHREWVTKSPRHKKKKQRDLRIAVLKNNIFKRFESKEAASYGYTSNPVKGQPDTAAASTEASCWDRAEANYLRSVIHSMRPYRNSKAAGVISAKDCKNGYVAEYHNNASEAMFQTRQKRHQSDYSFKEHEISSDHKFTVTYSGKDDSNSNDDILTEPVRRPCTQIKTPAKIREDTDPAPKRLRLNPVTFDSLQDSKDIVQLQGIETRNASSDWSNMKGAYCLASTSANYVLKDKGEDSDSALNRIPKSQTEQGGMDISEEVFPGDDEDYDVLILDIDEDMFWESI